jgi:hypothetical protein
MTDMGTATFLVSNFPWDGTSCWATEEVPAGYEQSATTCGAAGMGTIAVFPGVMLSLPACTITNRPTEAVFTIGKTFDDGNAGLGVAVTPVCTDDDGGGTITYTPAGGTAFQNTDVDVTVKYFHANAECGATEVEPQGYTQDNLPAGQDCQSDWGISDGQGNSCELYNELNTATWRVDKDFTDNNPGTVTMTLVCSSGDVSDPVVITEGNPQSLNVLGFNTGDYGPTSCSVVESNLPNDGYMEIGSTPDCDVDPVAHEGVYLGCLKTNEPTLRATFNVNKIFDDNNPMDVAVTLSCDTGIPLEQTKIISQGSPVEFVIVDFDSGELDCDITEVVPLGYSEEYEANRNGLDSDNGIDACRYLDIFGGEDHTCDIFNDLLEVRIDVTKVWIDDHPEFNNPTFAKANWECYNVQFDDYRDGFFGCDGDECGRLHFYGSVSSDSFTVFPDWDGTTYCTVEERVFESGVETSNNCGRLYVTPGHGNACTITNTRFYEGIPTLSQYGLAILALLMLGVGLVGFRRFV